MFLPFLAINFLIFPFASWIMGRMLFTLSAGIGFWPAATVSAAYFGYSHHLNSGEDWIGLCNAGAFGLLTCFLLRRTGNLWMPIGLHLAFDWGETHGRFPGSSAATTRVASYHRSDDLPKLVAALEPIAPPAPPT